MLRRNFLSALLAALLVGPAGAVFAVETEALAASGGQTPGGAQQQPQQQFFRGARVAVTGDARVEAQPDTAMVTLAVVTQNRNASEAQAENASKTDAVVRAVRAAAGAGAEVKTSGYSLQPQYVYKPNEPPLISGYIARNSVTVTTGEMNRVGQVIDAASRAGANSVDGIAFTLKRDEAARGQALGEATREALAKAQVVAQALGGRVVRVAEVQESGAVIRPPVPVMEVNDMAAARGAVASAPPTPVEPGTLTITSRVQLVVEVETRP